MKLNPTQPPKFTEEELVREILIFSALGFALGFLLGMFFAIM